MGSMTHNILLSMEEWGTKIAYLPGMGSWRTRDRSRHAQEEEGRMTSTLLPFVRPGSLHTPNFVSNVMRPKRFLSKPSSHVGWLRPTIPLASGGYPPTCFGRIRFIAWRQRCLFLGECRRGSKHFGNQLRFRFATCLPPPPPPPTH